MNNDIMVSVIMLAYNHEKYIAKAIESIIMQKVNFRYEIVIAEDCSTDNTRNIVLEYKNKYPDKIKLLLNSHNLGAAKNGYNAHENCLGKYTAILEGDDYWIDENKLQRQIDFLEQNDNYSAVYHNVKIIDQNDIERDNRFGYEIQPEMDIDKNIFYKDLFVRLQTGSLVAVNYWMKMTERQRAGYKNCKANGDQKVMLVLTCMGDIHVFSECMSACRKVISGGSSWTAANYHKNQSKYIFDSRLELIKYAKEYWNLKLDEKYLIGEAVKMAVSSALYRRKKEDFKLAKDVFMICNVKLYVIKVSFKGVFRYLHRKVKHIACCIKN